MVLIIYIISTIGIIFLNNFIFSLIRKKSTAVHIGFLHSLITAIIIAISAYCLSAQFPATEEMGKTAFRSGSIALAILTFAAQKTLDNIIGGFSISVSKPFAIGQKIKVKQLGNTIADGTVVSMTMRHTVIEQYDGQTCIVPNGIMNASTIVNTNYTENIGKIIEFELPTGADISEAKKFIAATCDKNDRILNHDDVLINRIADGKVILKVQIVTANIDDSYSAADGILQAFTEYCSSSHKNH
jgi:small-conductance mechanosensitive channel